MDEPLKFEKVSLDEAKKVLDSKPIEDAKPQDRDWRWARTFHAPPRLADKTVEWLHSLPEQVRPRELPKAYPRVANKLCEIWANREACDRYFDELSRDNRTVGGAREPRHGFPGPIPQELAVLRRYYYNPDDSSTLWDDHIYTR